jgi:hypothetical protein
MYPQYKNNMVRKKKVNITNSTHSLDAYNITLLKDLHICDQRNNFVFKILREHILDAFHLFLCTHHFGEFLEDGSSGQRALHNF